ncbi:[FeFe] hydrogenase H-cluster radical SAM maturase HydG [bacterium]|nr:[FeFe] hydrogenase H-cluster radical SAM maturase HydG [bacterium]
MEETYMIDERRIHNTLVAATTNSSDAVVNDVLAKSRHLRGLDESEVAILMQVRAPHLLANLFETARWVKDRIYGRRLVLFAPLYISNLCRNECLYCAFRAKNKEVKRRALTQPEIAREVKVLVEQGHKRVLLVAGESYPKEGLQYVLDAVKTVYSVKSGKGEIRRVNVNIAPLTVEEFRRLKDVEIGTYQLFQETYDRSVYQRVHLGGVKADYDWRITAMNRAMEAGIDDVGIGVLFGLADWRFEILAILQHASYLDEHFGVGPHTISVPRLEPATCSDMASHPPHPVSDEDFRKIVAILRLAVPYTGIIMSTRETARLRRETFALGVSQISAGSRTNPGGYSTDSRADDESQFSLGDHRPLDEVIRDISEMGYIPSFCTGCYRLGRTGQDFLDLAKPGEIRKHCDPNAISTFAEYLEDYASDETRRVGEKAIGEFLSTMDAAPRKRAEAMLREIREGQRDVFC